MDALAIQTGVVGEAILIVAVHLIAGVVCDLNAYAPCAIKAQGRCGNTAVTVAAALRHVARWVCGVVNALTLRAVVGREHSPVIAVAV